MPLYYPKRGEVYTVEQIVTELKLRDSPFLKANITNPLGEVVDVVIQLAYIDDYAKLIPIMGNDKYRYIRETDEWIPVFQFVGSEEEFLKSVDTAVDLNPHLEEIEPVGMVVWPKGIEYEQYYKLSDDMTALLDMYGSNPLPQRIKESLSKQK